MRENLTSGSEGGCWKHDLSHPWQMRVPVRQQSTLHHVPEMAALCSTEAR
jgi:hypothetical protein